LELDSGNQAWIPEPQAKTYSKDYRIDIPKALKPGEYELRLKLYSKERDRDVFLALDRQLLDEDNFYRIGTVTVIK
jgi:hypothetical protein